jgi:hypothetical protein
MRRFLIILLLLILPCQVTLAAVDLCCGFDRTTRHQPCAVEAQEKLDLSKPHSSVNSPIDAHCALCFLGSISIMSAPAVRKLPQQLEHSAAVASARIQFASHAAPRPERPQWQPAV